MDEVVRAISEALDLDIPDERISPLAEAYRNALAQSASIRVEQTVVPQPAPFDPAWEEQS